MPQKSFSGRKKQVRAAEKARLIRTLVKNDPMKYTDVVGHREQLGHYCSHWLEDDAGEVHHPDAEGCVPVHELGVLKVREHPLSMKMQPFTAKSTPSK